MPPAPPTPPARLARSVKRALDALVCAALLVLLSPLPALIALAILVTSGRPILIRQRRPGRHGRPFTRYIFRSMRTPAPGEPRWDSDRARTTPLGRVLRRSSLAELPELFNVLVGQMSLVGPRPLLMAYPPRYSPRHGRRHEVRPGITGPAHRELTLGQRLDLDIDYLGNWSLALDARILPHTPGEPLRRGDIPDPTLTDVNDVNLATPELLGAR
jgi:sugar transferase EpsL